MKTNILFKLRGVQMKQKSALISILVIALVLGGVLVSGCLGSKNNTTNTANNSSINSTPSNDTTATTSKNTKVANNDKSNSNDDTNSSDNDITSKVWVTCPTCGGDGFIPVGDHGEKQCPTCGGSGGYYK